MKKLLYIGNKLYSHGFNKTSIETLGLFLKQEGYKVTYTSSKKNQFLRLIDMMFATFISSKRVDYIIIDTYSTSSFWYAFFCSQIARVFKTKYIPTLRGGDLPNRLKKNPKLSKLIFNNALVNVAPSQYLKTEFEKFNFNNVIYIPNSVDLENYSFKHRKNLLPNILWVRAFDKIYNPRMAINVIEVLKENGIDAKLTMVGPDKDGSLISTKEYAKNKNIEVTFTGKLSRDEWINLSKEFNFFINTTHFDNTPVSVIEAMALGIPVISTNVGGIPYLLTHNINAILVKDNNAPEMAKAIIELLNDNDKVNFITHNAYQKVQEFNWKNVKEQWKLLLK